MQSPTRIFPLSERALRATQHHELNLLRYDHSTLAAVKRVRRADDLCT